MPWKQHRPQLVQQEPAKHITAPENMRLALSALCMIALRQAAAFIAFRGVGAAVSSASSSNLSMMSSTTATKPSLVETSTAYKDLIEKLQQITHLKHSQAVLNYDQLVFMPQSERASQSRGAQLAALAGIIHEKSTSPIIKELIAAAEADLEKHEGEVCGETKWEERMILELAREDFEKNERIPEELEAKRARLSSSAYAAWVKARSENDFKQFEPVLTDCFETAKETAVAVRGEDKKHQSLYTVMCELAPSLLDS